MYCSKYRKLNFLWSKPEMLDKSGLKEGQIPYGFTSQFLPWNLELVENPIKKKASKGALLSTPFSCFSFIWQVFQVVASYLWAVALIQWISWQCL